MRRQKWLIVLAVCMLPCVLPVMAQQEVAQVRISPTPIPAIIPTLTMLPTELALASATPTVTVSPELALQIEVRSQTNVRELPEPSSNNVGIVNEGDKYEVIGRYFRWLEFKYPEAEDGVAWVFEDNVTILGDNAAIPNVDPYAEPSATPDESQAILQETLAAVTLTPGADLTVMANQRVIEIPVLEGTGTATQESGVLPTYTPPAEVIPLNGSSTRSGGVNPVDVGVLEGALAQVTSGNVPPIVPIVLLAGFGLLGLLVSAIRR